MSITLNEGQRKAVDDFLGFYLSADSEHRLSGAPGTGKTTLIEHIISAIPDNNKIARVVGRPEINEVVIVASTNKAAEVLTQTFSSSKVTVTTINKALGVIPKYDFSQKKYIPFCTGKVEPFENTLLIADEASFIEPPLLQIMRERMHDSKIFYSGDKYQLLPVGYDFSPVFDDKSITESVLTESMRFNGNVGFNTYLEQLRDTIDTGQFHKFQLPSDNSIVWLNETGVNQFYEYFYSPEVSHKYSVKTLCNTNERVVQHNTLVRQKLGLPTEIQVGDVITANDAIITVESNKDSPQRSVVERPYRVSAISDIKVDEKTQINYREYKLDNLGTVRVPCSIREHKNLVRMYFKRAYEDVAFRPLALWLNENFGDIRHSYASTIHKAQGSTYDYVLIDLQDIFRHYPDPNTAARLLYVAFSRAKHQIYIYGNFPYRYGG